jgi:hypothetical protein
VVFVPEQPVEFGPFPTQSRKMTKLPQAQFLFPINQSNFSPFQNRREKGRNCPRHDFYFRSTYQLLAHLDIVDKTDEIAHGAVSVSDQPVEF